jgi:hypothetical protein
VPGQKNLKIRMRNRESTLMNANQGIQKKPAVQTGHLIGDGKFSGRNPPFVCINAN